MAKELAMYLAEKGRIVPAREYKYATDRPAFLSMKEIIKVMGSYTAAIDWIAKYQPDLWAIINGKETQVAEPVKEETVKPDPLAALAKSTVSITNE